MDDQIRRELHRLLSKLVDGGLPEEQERHLRLLLEQDREAQELYLNFFDLHAELSLSGGLSDPFMERPREAVSPPSATTQSPRIWTGWGLLSGTAVTSVLVIITIWLLFSSPPVGPATRIIARLDRVEKGDGPLAPCSPPMAFRLPRDERGLTKGQLIFGWSVVWRLSCRRR